MAANPEPISNTGITPSQPIGPGQPALGTGEEELGQRQFSLGADQGKVAGGEIAKLPNPMELAAHPTGQPVTADELKGNISNLQNEMASFQTKLQNPDVVGKLTPDHFAALEQAIRQANPSFQQIAKQANIQHTPVQKVKGESALSYVMNWINGGQQGLSGALSYVQGVHGSPNPANFLKMQAAVQHATQRVALFSSIIGSSVSGIKTLMSTQLG